ncbi:MAG: MOSC domain-containing protein, partial [Gammaproteobacteria bacterium]|nr:MOSC domain-containing protein [Gammaproteobacteria bacterium]
EGVALHESVGSVLHIGRMQLLITRETDPCERMREVHDNLFEAMAKDWRGGVCCRVIKDGAICVGDEVEIVDVQ